MSASVPSFALNPFQLPSKSSEPRETDYLLALATDHRMLERRLSLSPLLKMQGNTSAHVRLTSQSPAPLAQGLQRGFSVSRQTELMQLGATAQKAGVSFQTTRLEKVRAADCSHSTQTCETNSEEIMFQQIYLLPFVDYLSAHFQAHIL